MTPQTAFIELLSRVGAGNGAAVMVSEHELSLWPVAAVLAMKAQKLLKKARPANSAVCPGCEERCLMPVHAQPRGQRASAAFIVCDKRSDVNRVAVSVDRLARCQCSAEAITDFVADVLGLRRSNQPSDGDVRWYIGIASGDKRSQMLCLQADGALALVAGNNALPLADLIEHNDGIYSLDAARVRQLVDSATSADKRYTPNNAKREARKMDTQMVYAGWREAYREQRRKRAGMSDVWYSQQIAKSEAGRGRSAESIRRRMKK